MLILSSLSSALVIVLSLLNMLRPCCFWHLYSTWAPRTVLLHLHLLFFFNPIWLPCSDPSSIPFVILEQSVALIIWLPCSDPSSIPFVILEQSVVLIIWLYCLIFALILCITLDLQFLTFLLNLYFPCSACKSFLTALLSIKAFTRSRSLLSS